AGGLLPGGFQSRRLAAGGAAGGKTDGGRGAVCGGRMGRGHDWVRVGGTDWNSMTDSALFSVESSGRNVFSGGRCIMRLTKTMLTLAALAGFGLSAGAAELGWLSKKYEVGAKGNAGTISSGKGDPGGQSYGLYQLTTKNVMVFVAKHYPTEFKGLKS